jgi:hypothetical protein
VNQGDDDEARWHRAIAEACLADVSDAPLAPRLALYRRLVRNNLTGVTEKMLPRTRARLNEREAFFDASFGEFLANRGPRTHYLRDVPHEFLAWAEASWSALIRAGKLPRWALDLARHELAEYAIAAAPDARTQLPQAPVQDIALDRPIFFAEPVRVVRYAFAVHELLEDPADRTEPAARAVALLVYRDAANDVEQLELSPLGAALTERLLAGSSLGEAVTAACAALGLRRTEAIVGDVSALLANLADRGVVLGACARD